MEKGKKKRTEYRRVCYAGKGVASRERGKENWVREGDRDVRARQGGKVWPGRMAERCRVRKHRAGAMKKGSDASKSAQLIGQTGGGKAGRIAAGERAPMQRRGEEKKRGDQKTSFFETFQPDVREREEILGARE